MATPDDIKDALRAAQTGADINGVADKYRGEVRAIAKTDKSMALQIANLKAYRILELRNPQ